MIAPIGRALTLAVWAFAVWLLLTWTVTAEQLVFGAILALVVGAAMAPFGPVVRPWLLLDPRRLAAAAALLFSAAGRIVKANVGLARRIWTPSRPLASGMLIVATNLDTDAGLGNTGLITSLIVDNQIVDLDRNRHVLQYHAIAVPKGSKTDQYEAINGPVERLIARIDRRP
jgi:multicomponent Na+:H+ antiporter subunit E